MSKPTRRGIPPKKALISVISILFSVRKLLVDDPQMDYATREGFGYTGGCIYHLVELSPADQQGISAKRVKDIIFHVRSERISWKIWHLHVTDLQCNCYLAGGTWNINGTGLERKKQIVVLSRLERIFFQTYSFFKSVL